MRPCYRATGEELLGDDLRLCCMPFCMNLMYACQPVVFGSGYKFDPRLL
jgi:hypothetical protein